MVPQGLGAGIAVAAVLAGSVAVAPAAAAADACPTSGSARSADPTAPKIPVTWSETSPQPERLWSSTPPTESRTALLRVCRRPNSIDLYYWEFGRSPPRALLARRPCDRIVVAIGDPSSRTPANIISSGSTP